MSGTFVLKFKLFSSTGSFGTEASGYLTIPDYYVGLDAAGNPSAFTTARLDYLPPIDASISFDGGAYVDLSQLPLGLYLPLITANITSPLDAYAAYARQRSGSGALGAFSRVKFDYNGGSLTTQITGTGGVTGPLNTGASEAFKQLQDVSDLFLGPSITITVSDPTVTWSALAFQTLQLSGTYELISWSWQIVNGVSSGTPPADYRLFKAGSVFQVSSGGAGSSGSPGNIGNIYSTATSDKTGPDLKGTYGAGSGGGVTSIIFSWLSSTGTGTNSVEVLSADFDNWTNIFFSFLLPLTLPNDGTLITVSAASSPIPPFPASPAFPAISSGGGGLGTEFSGSIKLGTIKILTTEASGIYRIVSGKTSDTVYTDNPSSNDTEEFAIPNPHVKTGFIGG